MRTMTQPEVTNADEVTAARAAVDTIEQVLGRTDNRVQALRDVADEVVTYNARHAQWSVRGAVVGGWSFRTLTELRTVAAVRTRPADDEGMSIVELTASGRGLLSRWLD